MTRGLATRALAPLGVAALLGLPGACGREAPAPAGETPAPVPASASAATGSASSGPLAALDRMDRRAPVPLLPMMAHHQKENMRDHLAAVQEIVTALAVEDFDGVEKAAARIGYSERMGMMCNHMGAGAPGFTKQALEFHRTADRIATAARDKDQAKVLSELGATLKTCTSCHAVWKQEVLSQEEWQRRVGEPPPSAPGH